MALTRRWTVIAALAVGTVAGTVEGTASARPIGPVRLCEVYPLAPACAGGPATCTTCHVSTDAEEPTWNAYGEAVRTELDGDDFDQWIVDALMAIDGDDADADGFANGEELESGSHPGDADSLPVDPSCPDDVTDLPYALCQYDPPFAFKRVMLDFCGRSPTYEAMEDFRALGADEQLTVIDSTLGTCLGSEYWRGEKGVLWQLAYPKVRPVQALKAGRDASAIEQLRTADYYNDIMLYAWAQVDGNDARAVLTADFYALQDGLEFTVVDEIGLQSEAACVTDDECPANELCQENICVCPGGCVEGVQNERRYGLLTTRWNLLYNTMFTSVPRSTAAQAYRAFLGLDIAKQQGLQPVEGELIDYDEKGVTAAECAVCHRTLDPLTYPFTRYTGYGPGGRALYVEDRMSLPPIVNEAPLISETPEAGVIFGVEVDGLEQWADVAANSPQFASNAVGDYWKRTIGRPPINELEAEEFAALAADLMTTHDYSIDAMLHDLVRTEAYGAP